MVTSDICTFFNKSNGTKSTTAISTVTDATSRSFHELDIQDFKRKTLHLMQWGLCQTGHLTIAQ